MNTEMGMNVCYPKILIQAKVCFGKLRRNYMQLSDVVQEGLMIYHKCTLNFSSVLQCSFSTYLIQALQKHYGNLVKQSYKFHFTSIEAEQFYGNSRRLQYSGKEKEIGFLLDYLENASKMDKSYVLYLLKSKEVQRASQGRRKRLNSILQRIQ